MNSAGTGGPVHLTELVTNLCDHGASVALALESLFFQLDVVLNLLLTLNDAIK